MPPKKPYWHPVLSGIGLGLVLVLAFYVSGRGIGATGGITRLIALLHETMAPARTAQTQYFTAYLGEGIFSYLVLLLGGLLLGSFFSAWQAGDLQLSVLRGPGISRLSRLILAFSGGVLVGFAARLARGCTSGQALVGGAQLSLGAWVFMAGIFLGGFGAAWLVRRQWL